MKWSSPVAPGEIFETIKLIGTKMPKLQTLFIKINVNIDFKSEKKALADVNKTKPLKPAMIVSKINSLYINISDPPKPYGSDWDKKDQQKMTEWEADYAPVVIQIAKEFRLVDSVFSKVKKFTHSTSKHFDKIFCEQVPSSARGILKLPALNKRTGTRNPWYIPKKIVPLRRCPMISLPISGMSMTSWRFSTVDGSNPGLRKINEDKCNKGCWSS